MAHPAPRNLAALFVFVEFTSHNLQQILIRTFSRIPAEPLVARKFGGGLMTRFRSVAGLLILIAGFAMSVAAQGTADIVGRISDSSGGVLPNTAVTARDVGTNILRTTTTSSTGDFTFTALPIGDYEVKTELSGFRTETRTITLSTGDRARVDFALQPGGVNEVVRVEADVQRVQTDQAEVASHLNNQLTENVPVVGRNIINIVQLVPGAAEGTATATISGNRPDDRRQTSAVAVMGWPENENRHMIDGVDNEERVMGAMGIKPSLEAIQEVDIKTNSYSADMGRTLSAVINLVTKSGTNEFHGTVYEFFKNDALNARPFFALTRPPDHENQFGGALGGPVIKNRTFFFIDYDQDRIQNAYQSVITVPTTLMQQGNFSQLSAPIYNPLSTPRMPFAGNIIPQSMWGAGAGMTQAGQNQAVVLMGFFPKPNLPGTANNFAYNGPMFQHNQTADLRFDHHIDAKDTVFARYSYNLTNGIEGSQCPNVTYAGNTYDPVCNTNGTAGIYSGPYHTYADNVVANWLRIWGPTTVQSVTFNFVRPLTSAGLPPTPSNGASLLGFQNVNFPSQPITNGLPWIQMNPTSYAALGDPTFIPMATQDHNFQVDGFVSKVKGSHNIKIGAGLVWRLFGVQQSQYPRGTYIFDSSLTNNGSGAGGNTFASFLLGFPTQEQRIFFPIMPRNRSKEPSFYVMDDWHATPWLTFNLGLRYEVFTPITEAGNNMSAWNPATNSLIVASSSNPSAGVKTDFSDIGPRAGMAATLPGKFVFRLGYGIYYDPVLRGAGSYLKNPPVTENFGPYTSAGSSGGLPNLFLSDVFPTLAFNNPANPAGTITSTALNYKIPRSQEFSAALEKEVKGFVLSASYVGYYSNRYPLNQNINLPCICTGSVNANRPLYSLYPALTTVNIISNHGIRTYDSLILKADRRFSNGLTLSTNLTWGHAQENLFLPWNAQKFYWGDIPNYDIRMKWTAIASYQLPFFERSKGIAHYALGGWQMNVTAFWSTGIDYGVYDASSQMNQGLASGADEGPNLVPGCNPNSGPGIGTVQEWFNTSCFSLNSPRVPGTVGLGTMHGPPQRRLDFALAHIFQVRERQQVIFRAEAYNITNTPSFQPPDANFGDTTFGTLSSTGNAPPRTLQLGLKLVF